MNFASVVAKRCRITYRASTDWLNGLIIAYRASKRFKQVLSAESTLLAVSYESGFRTIQGVFAFVFSFFQLSQVKQPLPYYPYIIETRNSKLLLLM